jgi:protoheme IX farnesyltransferase
MFLGTLRTYYRLTKPGIIRGNALAASAGFFLATPARSFSPGLFALMLIGLSLVIGSACVFNNVLDRRIDAVMARTKKRALVTGRVTTPAALIYATILGVAGFTALALATNLLATVLAAVGFIFYIALYGLAKRRTPWGTEVGSISGAIPPVVGYSAASGRFDIGALLLFLVLVLWQMPHFYAIAIYRLSDYQSAKIPVLPAVKGIAVTVRRMIIYVCAFVVAVVALAVAGPATRLFGLVVGIVSVFWLRKVLAGLHATDHEAWAKSIFRFSLLVMLTVCLMSGVDLIVRSL